jgi:HAE1 family hydrophobic/amphiphilic exporter-1
VQVDLIRDRLISANLSARDIVESIAKENANLPGGNIRSGIGDLYVRTLGEFTDPEQIANTIVRMVDGSPIRIQDVARVGLGYQDIVRSVEINQRPTVPVDIRKQEGANTVAVAAMVNQAIGRINASRNDLQLIMVTDQSEFIQSSIDNVRNSAVWGGLLAVIVLFALFRNGSVTIIIAISIPISIIATFGLLYFNGLTLNQMSFGGIALGVGLIVDNAIVVLENIVRKRQQGLNLESSAEHGTREVVGAIIASTITTSAIFLPEIFMQTVTGSMFQELALVVVFALAR